MSHCHLQPITPTAAVPGNCMHNEVPDVAQLWAPISISRYFARLGYTGRPSNSPVCASFAHDT